MSQKRKLDGTIVLFCIVSSLVGLFFFVAGIMLQIDTSNFKKNAVLTEGVVTSINQYLESDEETVGHEVTVDFTVDGVVYEGITDEWDRHMYEGQAVTVFYSQENLGDFRLNMPSSLFAFVITLAGLCGILMAAVFFTAELSSSLSSMLIGCMVFFIVGILSFVGGLGWHISKQNFKKTALQTESVIVSIDQYEDSEYPDVTVAYTAGGVEYQGGIDEWRSDMYVGQPITIFYNSENPRDFRTGDTLGERALILAGIFFLLISSTPYIMALMKYIALRGFTGNNSSRNNENSVYTDKGKVLKNAPILLNKPGQPWEVVVKGDTIEARWKWKSVSSTSAQLRMKENLFVFAVTLNDAGKWWEALDMVGTTPNSPGFREFFVGKTYQKSLVFSLYRDKQTGKIKLKKDMEMDTATIKRTIREYLKGCGWRKARLFGL